jgi:hypothetical protein
MKKQFIIYLVVAAVLGMVPLLLLPPVNSQAVGIDSALLFIIPIFVTQAGALWYFLTSIKAFQHKLRVAYYLLVAGLVMFCLAQLQLPVTILLSILEIDPTLVQLLLLVPYIFGTLVMYISMRKFAKLLQVHSKWASWGVAIPFGLGLAIISQLLPMQVVPEVPESPQFILALIAWSGAFGVAAAMVAWRIRSTISQTYKPLMSSLTTAFAVFGVGYLLVVLFQTVGSYAPAFLDFYTRFNLWLLPLTVVSALLLRAGQHLRMISRQYGVLADNASPVEVVVEIAGLASDTRAIDPIIDPIRAITATQDAGAELSSQETAKVVAAYLKLEDYLVTKEPLRTFDRDNLRGHLPTRFQQLLK